MKKHEHQKKVTKPKVSPIVKEKVLADINDARDVRDTIGGEFYDCNNCEDCVGEDCKPKESAEVSHDAEFRARNRIPY